MIGSSRTVDTKSCICPSWALYTIKLIIMAWWRGSRRHRGRWFFGFRLHWIDKIIIVHFNTVSHISCTGLDYGQISNKNFTWSTYTTRFHTIGFHESKDIIWSIRTTNTIAIICPSWTIWTVSLTIFAFFITNCTTFWTNF